MMLDFFRNEALLSLTKSVRECVLMNGRLVYDGIIRMMFGKLGFVDGGCCFIFSDYHRLRNETKIPETTDYALYEKRLYATHASGAERKVMRILCWSAVKRTKETKYGGEKYCCCVAVLCGGVKRTTKWLFYCRRSAYHLWMQ